MKASTDIFINFLCFFSGFIIILNPFEKGCQRYWVDRCIETYPQSPNITNIDPQLSTVDNHDVWKYSKTHHRLDKWIHLPIHMAFQNLCCVLYQNCFKFSGICYYTPTLKDSITCLYEQSPFVCSYVCLAQSQKFKLFKQSKKNCWVSLLHFLITFFKL